MLYICSLIHSFKKCSFDNAVCSNMERSRDDHTKSQRQIAREITYVWNLKCDTNKLIYKTLTDSPT